jgi:ApaG protein
MNDNEREENLKIHKQLYEDSVKMNRLGDRESASKARIESNERMDADPWFNLNERMEEAVKLQDEEEISYLKEMIEKFGGPPPSLKDKVNEKGYVPVSSIYSLTLSNDRLERLINDYKKEEQMELLRKDMVLKELEDIDEAKYDTREQDEMWVAEMAEQRYWDRIYWMGEKVPVNQDLVENRKEKMDKERKKLIEKWKELGVDQTPEDFYSDWDTRKEELDTRLTKHAKEVRRKDLNYEGADEIEFNEDGVPMVSREYWQENVEGSPIRESKVSKFVKKRAMEENGRPRVPGERDVFIGELDPSIEINEGSTATTGPLTVEVNSQYNTEQSDPPMRKHTFQYTVRITNNSDNETVQLLSRKFFIQTLGNEHTDIVQGEGVTGRQPVLKPGEVFEYTSTAPLNTRPVATTIIAARMRGEYRYCTLTEGQETATEEQINKGEGEAGAQMGMFYFVFPEEQRVKKWWSDDEDLDEDDDDEFDDGDMPAIFQKYNPARAKKRAPVARDATVTQSTPRTPPNSLPGDPDITSGNLSGTPNDSSDTVSSDVRVMVTSKYLPERSDPAKTKYCFAYNVRISNESKDRAIQLVSRRFEIQNIGSQTKDVVQGANVTGRQPVLKPGENFEYTSTAPLSVTPMLDKTRVLSRMSGEYNCVLLADDGVTPLSSTPLKAELGTMHFILPDDQ